MTKKQEKEIILQVAKSVRDRIIKHYSTTSGMCWDASWRIIEQLKGEGIKVKLVQGVFAVDYDLQRRPVYMSTHDEGHFWCEWNKIPIDVTADQFNPQLKSCNKVKPIIFGTNKDRYLTMGFRRRYKSK